MNLKASGSGLGRRLGVWGFLTCWLAFAGADEIQPPGEDAPEPPVQFALIAPPEVRAVSCNGAGVAVDYPLPVVRTGCHVPAVLSCDPPTGSVFPVGDTVVTCLATTDCGERAAVTFLVRVRIDRAAPVLTLPSAPQVVYAPNRDGVEVDYPWPAVTDDADDNVKVVCDPPPGSRFPVGVARVHCVATDACGRGAQGSFEVEVRPARLGIRPASLPDPTGGPGRPGVAVHPAGLAGVDVAASLDGDWAPLGPEAFDEPVDRAPARFFRPAAIEGVLRGPQVGAADVAYVQVGLLPAYSTPGLTPLRQVPDDVSDGETLILSGTAGGSGVNRWSVPQNLPFTFHFFGRPYTRFRVSKNGLLTFSTNIITGQEGLAYFSFQQSQTTNQMQTGLPLWTNGFAVDNTIFCMAGRYVEQSADDRVEGRVYGTAPHRQAWIIFRHPKDISGQTTTAIVLEETSNRILLMDMEADAPGNSNSRLVAGLQGSLNSLREVRQVPATPAVRLAGLDWGRSANGCYLFHPYVPGLQKSGDAAASLVASTNLDLFISERLRRDNIPGVTVAISDHGRLIFNKAYGYANVEQRQIMRPYHRACIGSTSKVLAALGVELLIQQNQLPGLGVWAFETNRLGKAWFWNGVNEGIAKGIHKTFGVSTTLTVISNITIRHLLSHTAALGTDNDTVGAANAYAGGDYSQLTARQRLRWFMASEELLTNRVARLRRYSNPSFMHLGVLIEEVAGQPFEAWMMENILVPGGAPFARMLRTFEEEETWRDARRYYAYQSGAPWKTNRLTGVLAPRPYGDAIGTNAADGGAGAWTATAADLVRLMAALDRFPNKPDILKAGRIDELDEVAFPAASATQGIGWDTCSLVNNWVQKNGNIGFGSSHLMRSMTNGLLTVAVVANSGIGDASGNTAVTTLCRELFNAVRPLPPVNPNYDLFPAQLQAP